MQYDLDPRLLPPSGASVQCTRCSFVFTALPSGEVLVPGQGQGGAGSKAGEAPRSAVGTSTQVFGSPYAASGNQGAPSPTTTQVFGAVSVPGIPGAPPPSDRTPVFGSRTVPAPLDRTPAYGSGTVPPGSAAGASLPAAGKTQVFGAATQPAPSPATTQVFGAVSIPPPAPSAASTQVFGAPAAPTPPLTPTTTQVFGAASVPPQASPASTQVFGATAVAAKAPSPTTTQVFGAASVAAPLATTATTQTFGAAEVQAARKAMEGAAPAPAPSATPAPWMAKPGPSPAPHRSAPSIALPDEPVPQPGVAHLQFPAQEPAAARSAPLASSRHSAPIELPPEMLIASPSAREEASSSRASGGGKERLLLILAAIMALGLTAWLSYPVWRNRGSELPPEAVAAKDQAVSLLRRDDATSRQQAIDLLRGLTAQFPKFTEAQAELVVALSLQLDDLKAEIESLGLEEQRVHRALSALEVAKSPADWPSRVNARRQEMAALGAQKQPLEADARELTKQLDQLLPALRAAPETEPSADVVARWKALAVHEGVRGNPQAIALAERLAKVESPPLWSVVTRVEYGLNASSPANALPDLSDALAKVREQDKTFFRAYVLGARLALRLNDQASAQTLLGTVVALNPNHTLALKLQKQAASAAPSP
jgi:hypothetical protein